MHAKTSTAPLVMHFMFNLFSAFMSPLPAAFRNPSAALAGQRRAETGAYHSNGLEGALEVALYCAGEVVGMVRNRLALIAHTAHLHSSIHHKTIHRQTLPMSVALHTSLNPRQRCYDVICVVHNVNITSQQEAHGYTRESGSAWSMLVAASLTPSLPTAW